MVHYLTKEARIYNGVKTVYSINGAGKNWMDTYKKNETRPPSYTIYRYWQNRFIVVHVETYKLINNTRINSRTHNYKHMFAHTVQQ